MKKKFAVIIVGLLLLLCFSAASLSADDNDLKNEEVIFDESEALKSRFLNMLNHSFVYNEDIADAECLVNNSMPAIMNMREDGDSDFIRQDIVANYVYDMYGVVVEDFSAINANFKQKSGFVYIIPRGYTVYRHKMISVKQNEDESFTVRTSVEIDAHDSEIQILECETLFVKNENSSFGFNIIRSDILDTCVSQAI